MKSCSKNFCEGAHSFGGTAEQGEDTIDLLELFMGLLAHWTLIAATAVVGAVLMALYTFFLVTPMYKATAPFMWSAAMIRC